MLNGPMCAAALARTRGSLRVGTAVAVSLLVLAGARAAAAQAFQLPQECTHGATGSEGTEPGKGDDPVVIVSQGASAKPFNDFTVVHRMGGSWAIRMTPAPAATYNVITTYTPFLTSSRLVQIPYSRPSFYVLLPAPGVTDGRQWKIYDTYTVTVMDSTDSQALPYAFVDFIPFFVGSSPLTIQADGNGQIVLNCVQQVSTAYDITVYDRNHKYVYDGSFPTTGSATASALDNTSGSSRTRPGTSP